LLGPGAILGEAVYEGAVIGNKVLGGKPADIAYAESYLSYLDPRKYRGELDPLKMAREDMLTREVEDAQGNIKTIAAPGSSILKSGFAAQDQLSAFNKAIEDRDLAKARGRIDQYIPAAAEAREQGARAGQSADIISSEAFKDASRVAQEYLQGQTGANIAKYRTDDFGRFESGRDRDLRRRRMQEMSNIMPRDFLTEKTSDLLDRTQALRELGYDEEFNSYDILTWFVAYLIHNTSEETFRVDFWTQIEDLGFEEAFKSNFGKSADEMIAEFDTWVAQPIDVLLEIIP